MLLNNSGKPKLNTLDECTGRSKKITQVSEPDGTLKFFGPQEDLATAVEQLVKIAKLVLRSERRIFHADSKRSTSDAQHDHASKIVQAIHIYLPRVREALPHYRCNPYVALVDDAFPEDSKAERAVEKWHAAQEQSLFEECESVAKRLNRAVRTMRDEASGSQFRRALRDFIRSSVKNRLTLDKYIDELFEGRSRLLAVRVDLTYGKYAGLLASTDRRLSIDLVKSDWLKMLKAFRCGLSDIHLKGFAYKIEYGSEKKFHIHVLLLLDGSKVRQDVSIARKVGEYWTKMIPDGQGLYYNCNANKLAYKKQALGMIDWRDLDKREILSDCVTSYLTKPDMYLPLVLSGDRTFGKGVIPRGKSTRGRSRTQ